MYRQQIVEKAGEDHEKFDRLERLHARKVIVFHVSSPEGIEAILAEGKIRPAVDLIDEIDEFAIGGVQPGFASVSLERCSYDSIELFGCGFGSQTAIEIEIDTDAQDIRHDPLSLEPGWLVAKEAINIVRVVGVEVICTVSYGEDA